MKTLLICCSITFLFVAGCTTMDTIDFERNTMNKLSAQNIGNNLRSYDITITDIESWMFGKTWKATTPDGTVYKCDSGTHLEEVNCVLLTEAPTDRVERYQSIKEDIQVESDRTIKENIQVESDRTIKEDIQVESYQTIKEDVQVEGFGDLYTDLMKLQELKDFGIITEDEFQTIKKKIIERY